LRLTHHSGLNITHHSGCSPRRLIQLLLPILTRRGSMRKSRFTDDQIIEEVSGTPARKTNRRIGGGKRPTTRQPDSKCGNSAF
jgi:hypothetical protein